MPVSRFTTVVIAVGAGVGLSTPSALDYGGSRFGENFADFIDAYKLTDMYSPGFYPFKSLEERWTYWRSYIFVNRCQPIPGNAYSPLLKILDGKNYFVITTRGYLKIKFFKIY